jgi:hypothetical protein
VSGRGWAALVDDEAIEGHLFFHPGEDSSLRAERSSTARARPARHNLPLPTRHEAIRVATNSAWGSAHRKQVTTRRRLDRQ